LAGYIASYRELSVRCVWRRAPVLQQLSRVSAIIRDHPDPACKLQQTWDKDIV